MIDQNQVDPKAYMAGYCPIVQARERKIGIDVELQDEYYSYRVVRFQITPYTPIWKIKKYYSRLINVPQHALRFLYNGTRLNDFHTPKELDMGNLETIEVFFGQPRCLYENILRRSRLTRVYNPRRYERDVLYSKALYAAYKSLGIY